tara:strand:- start:1365 stop:1526 length:162 start_codon:yes stop_codon:yes gene_type:complete
MDKILKDELKLVLNKKFGSSTKAIETLVTKPESLDDDEIARLLNLIEELEELE